jgi:hypothetical protein
MGLEDRLVGDSQSKTITSAAEAGQPLASKRGDAELAKNQIEH